MFCIKCGKELKEGEKYCSNCGNPVGNNATFNTDSFGEVVQNGLELVKNKVQESNLNNLLLHSTNRTIVNILIVVVSLIICFMTPNNAIKGTWVSTERDNITISISDDKLSVNGRVTDYYLSGQYIIVRGSDNQSEKSRYSINDGKLTLDGEVLARKGMTPFTLIDYVVLLLMGILLFFFNFNNGKLLLRDEESGKLNILKYIEKGKQFVVPRKKIILGAGIGMTIGILALFIVTKIADKSKYVTEDTEPQEVVSIFMDLLKKEEQAEVEKLFTKMARKNLSIAENLIEAAKNNDYYIDNESVVISEDRASVSITTNLEAYEKYYILPTQRKYNLIKEDNVWKLHSVTKS